MNDNTIDILFTMNPKISNVPKMRDFLRKGHHWTFEKADMQNNTEWFDVALEKKWLPAMIAHRESCRGVFDFENFDQWCATKFTMNNT